MNKINHKTDTIIRIQIYFSNIHAQLKEKNCVEYSRGQCYIFIWFPNSHA